jgi:hypothetical protein
VKQEALAGGHDTNTVSPGPSLLQYDAAATITPSKIDTRKREAGKNLGGLVLTEIEFSLEMLPSNAIMHFIMLEKGAFWRPKICTNRHFCSV